MGHGVGQGAWLTFWPTQNRAKSQQKLQKLKEFWRFLEVSGRNQFIAPFGFLRSPSAASPAKRVAVESEEIPTRVQFSAKPETERWREFLSWSCWTDLNRRPHPYQLPWQYFLHIFLVYSCFCSILFAFRHSLQTGFPYIPRLSVADYVVRNPCGTWVSSPEAILFQAKKVVKFESGRLKPTVNSGEVSSDELHLRLQ